uniref:Transforming growth factor, alpha n=1 Tax=Neolamprologus brichardi TaxID=32507 RepID=A0A3Q4HUB1_NEOBR
STAVSFLQNRSSFVAAAVRSHFDDCPDSHRHFCFHGTCRFLILEETPACVCHPGFIGMRCEHADLLAVVATNHRQQTIATVLVLCVIGCVLIMVLSCAHAMCVHCECDGVSMPKASEWMINLSLFTVRDFCIAEFACLLQD